MTLPQKPLLYLVQAERRIKAAQMQMVMPL